MFTSIILSLAHNFFIGFSVIVTIVVFAALLGLALGIAMKVVDIIVGI